MRSIRLTALVALLLVVATGCQLLSNATRYAKAPGSVSEPWWCGSGGGTPLTPGQCQTLSQQLDLALLSPHVRPYASIALAGGATSSPYVAGVGAAFRFSGPTAQFAPHLPDTLLYDGVDPGSQVAGIEWNVASVSAPDGFVGDHDVWTDLGAGVWQLRAWIVRPFENQPDLFASMHPCLGASSAVYDLSDSCYTSTHPQPLRVLVTNDDGYSADGIDAAVEALLLFPNLDVTVVAPALNQSGSGDSTTPGGVTATAQLTDSLYPATAVNGFPGDAVLYALNTMQLNPDLVVSGINEGENLGPIVDFSGTVGAARIAGRNGISAVALSQGDALIPPATVPPDYPKGATALVDWLTDYLLGRAGPPFQTVASINIPTCEVGSIRGTVKVPVATVLHDFGEQPDCLSTLMNPADDTDAFQNGYISLSDAKTS